MGSGFPSKWRLSRRIAHRVAFKLSATLAALALGTVAVVYVGVVPALKRRLIADREHTIDVQASRLAKQIPRDPYNWQPFAEKSARNTGDRVAVLASVGGELLPIADSVTAATEELTQDPIAGRAAQKGTAQTGIIERHDHQWVESARPARGGTLLVIGTLRDVSDADSVVGVRVLGAGLLGALGAIVIGVLLAARLDRRLRRIEAQATRIARGDFTPTQIDASNDEFGRLGRTLETMREQLAHLDRARNAFIANASHELRTPIFALGGFLELLSDTSIEDEVRSEFFETMEAQVYRLQRLTNDLLDLSRIDAGGMPSPIPEEINLGELVQELVQEFKAPAKHALHMLRAKVDRPHPWVRSDEGLIFRIGRVLVENAIVHTPGGTRIEVRAARKGDYAVLEVEDGGPLGIRPEDQERIFARFYRVDDTLASGSGLGLSVGLELAKLLDAELSVKSTPGQTIFTLRLPLIRPAPGDERWRANAEPAQQRPQAD